ncbi:SHOCT domain-containing protein [Kitasatospora sp. NPDC101176]|uniref:SHOCT domain-containing protein n=1 Tax=Kitasatospora sp. NPDC101176 TaxID=3364099 RepID=UPI0037FC17D0
MMYWNDHGMNGWGIGLMTVSMLLFWALLAVGVVALVRYVGRTTQHHPTAPPPTGATDRPTPDRPTPEQVLAERLARGEIDHDEYRQRLGVLRGGPGSG